MANKTITTPSDTVAADNDKSEVTSEVVEIPRHITDAHVSRDAFIAEHGENIESSGLALDDIFCAAWAELLEEQYVEFHSAFSDGFKRKSYLATYKAGNMASVFRCLEALNALVPKAYETMPAELRDALSDYELTRNGAILEAIAADIAAADKERKVLICEAVTGWLNRTAKSQTLSAAMSEVDIKAAKNSKVGKSNKKTGANTKNSKGSKAVKADEVFKLYKKLARAEMIKFDKMHAAHLADN